MHCIIFIRFVKNYLWDISFLIHEVCCLLIFMHLFTNKHEHLYQCPVIIFQSFANINDLSNNGLNQWLLQQPIDYKIQNFPEDQDLSPILTDHEGGEITSEWWTGYSSTFRIEWLIVNKARKWTNFKLQDMIQNQLGP